MKYLKIIFALITVLVFSSFHATAMGFLPPEDMSDLQEPQVAAAGESDFQKCLPHQVTPDTVCYISGGISGDEVAQFKSQAKAYLLEVVFVQKANAADNDRIEEYLAEVQLQIMDSKGNEVVNTKTDGPFFLADLPLGKYQVIADHDGVIKKDVIKIIAKKHQRIVFLWPR